MAVLKGIKEKVHLPLYDSLFVRPRKQLREVESSSVLKFFVNVQGKTKLETNMQSASLLPHWNTFEARALRVVISDLPARFPKEVEKCIQEPNGTADNPALSTLIRCLEDLSKLIDDEKKGVTDQLPNIEKCVTKFAEVVKKGEGIKVDLDGCLNKFTSLSDQQTIGCILQLKEICSNLIKVIEGIRSKAKRDQVGQIAS
ncbi:hypothetical protein HYR99_16230 [Candidatus Poribacteria bacterium]|nr:hypothetical protein [Candidatus Poribacteria bacterium]